MSLPRITENDKHISEAVAAALLVDFIIFESEVTVNCMKSAGSQSICKHQDPVALEASAIHLLQRLLLTVDKALQLCLAFFGSHVHWTWSVCRLSFPVRFR